MKPSLCLCVALIAALGHAVDGFFLGPTAVGVGLGALAATKGLILGSVLGQSRVSERGGRSYNRYNRRNHYSQRNSYYSHYTQPRSVRNDFQEVDNIYLTFAVLVLLLLTKLHQLRQEGDP